jgi:hypothetical protein
MSKASRSALRRFTANPAFECPKDTRNTGYYFSLFGRAGKRLSAILSVVPSPKNWWSWTGSNRRPPACKAGALPTELQPPDTTRVQKHNQIRSKAMVGLGRLELPTSRLSSARSNQLSYRPLTTDRSIFRSRRKTGRKCWPDHQTEQKTRPAVAPGSGRDTKTATRGIDKVSL